MPAPVVVKAGVIAVTVVVAAGIAIYESPELRRMAEDLRRRIAVALHSLGDSISPQERENLFNRPEDAEGFLRSRGIDVRGEGGEQGVDADEETRRRQREELMYWNALADEKREKELRDSRGSLSEHRRGSSFDDFLKQDAEADKGTYVFNSSADIRGGEADGLRHRGDASRGLAVSAYTNPFADEHGIDEHIVLENSLEDPADKDETGTDIYSVSNDGRNDRSSATLSAPFEQMPALVEFEAPAEQTNEQPTTPTVERQLAPDEYMTAGQDDRAHDAYTSIQAWAQNANSGFYSPLPVSPARTASEPELVSDGALTPTDSASVVDVADEVRSVNSQGQSRYFDVISESEGMATPASWSEVGSVVSENDAHQPVHA